MGREARARKAAGEAPRGLPETPRLGERRILKRDVEQIRRQGKTPRINFSDRAYVLDAHGTLRRAPIVLAPPTPPRPTMTITEMPSVSD